MDGDNILDCLKVRISETMVLSDLEVRCGHLPTGTLVCLKRDFDLYYWHEIGLVKDMSTIFEYETVNGEAGNLDQARVTVSSDAKRYRSHSNQLEVTTSGKKVWWQVWEVGTLETGTTLMLLGHMVFPWLEGGAIMDRYVQIWQPIVSNEGGARFFGPFAWNFFAGNYDFKVRGNLGYAPLIWSHNGGEGLCLEVANQIELKFDQPLEVKKAIEELGFVVR